MIILKQSPADVLRVKLGAAVTTTELPIYCAFVDRTTTTFNPDNNNTVTAGTAYVNIAGTPAASTQRQVKFFSIQNSDTVSATVIVEHYNATNGRQLCKFVLVVNDTLQFVDGEGFRVIDTNGQVKQSVSTTGVLLVANNLSDVASAPTSLQNLGYDDTITKAYAKLGSVLLAQTLGMSAGVINLATATPIDQQIIFMPVYLPKPATITGAKWYQSTAGVYTANNYNGVGLYSYSGGTLTLVASSTDDGNIWKSSGYQSKAFSGTYAAVEGIYFIAIIYCRSAVSTAPQWGRTDGVLAAGVSSVDFTNSAKLGCNITAQTSLPASQAMSGLSANGTASRLWLAIY